MKFIPGSQFINNTSKFGKYFKNGVTYTIKNIKKEDEGIKYIFTYGRNEEKDIIFKDVKEADQFLSNF